MEVVLQGRKRGDESVAYGFSCWFPAGFDGVELGAVWREVFDVKCLFMVSQEGIDSLSVMARSVVYEEANLSPAL